VSDPTQEPGWRLRERLLARDLSAVELVGCFLARIERLEPTLHAFVTVAGEQALADAAVADAAIARREAGPLCGLPVALKDELWTAGLRSTGGSLLYEHFVPEQDGAVAARLRAAGAIVIGKTNLPEFCTFPRSVNRLVPESRNPWDLRRTSGASSGGSAAAVAALAAPLAVGSDGGGSIRIPASLCGTFGLHPTVGRVPSQGSFSYSRLSSVGPLARDVRDAAQLLQVIAGPEPGDPTCWPDDPPDFLRGLDEGVRGLRLALVVAFEQASPRREVRDAVVAAAGLLAREGAIVEEPAVIVPDVWDAWIAVRNGRAAYDPGPVPFTQTAAFRARLEEPDTRDLLCAYNREGVTTRPVTREQWAQGERACAAARRQLDRLLDEHAVILTPTMLDVAPLVPERLESPYPDDRRGTNLTMIVNFTGCTAASHPCGTVDGLPVGLQVIGRPGDEATVLRVCRALERVLPWRAPPPA
jgi:Asp-tRNA(Asn)/Glu-tRNA(Gln) amidotransferase A subunit family amidase